jgi:anaerobic ribonucleoside-triphosphate reductase
LKVNDWRVKENSTVTYSVGGLILSNSGAITANYWLSEIYDDEIANAHRNGDMHIHDLSMLTGYCAGWSLKSSSSRTVWAASPARLPPPRPATCPPCATRWSTS